MSDIKNSSNFMEKFISNNNGSNLIGNCEFYTEILTSGHWPYSDVPVCKIPK